MLSLIQGRTVILVSFDSLVFLHLEKSQIGPNYTYILSTVCTLLCHRKLFFEFTVAESTKRKGRLKTQHWKRIHTDLEKKVTHKWQSGKSLQMRNISFFVGRPHCYSESCIEAVFKTWKLICFFVEWLTQLWWRYSITISSMLYIEASYTNDSLFSNEISTSR